MEHINLTNCTATVNGRTLTALIAQKDALTLQDPAYREILQEASQANYRARGTENPHPAHDPGGRLAEPAG